MRKLITLILNISLFLWLCFSPTLHAATADRIAAVVNNEPIMQSEMEDILAPIYMNLKQEISGAALGEELERARIKILNQL